MKHWIRPLLLSAIACCGLCGCGLISSDADTDITRDPRFQNVMGTVIHTRQKLYLYRQGSNISPQLRSYCEFRKSREGNDPENFIAVVPAGHPVKFTKMLRMHDSGSGFECIFGEITLNGKVYPVEEDLSASIYPDGWQLMLHDLFDFQA